MCCFFWLYIVLTLQSMNKVFELELNNLIVIPIIDESKKNGSKFLIDVDTTYDLKKNR